MQVGIQRLSSSLGKEVSEFLKGGGIGNVTVARAFCSVDSCCGDPVCVPVSLAAQCPPISAQQTASAARVHAGAGTFGG